MPPGDGHQVSVGSGVNRVVEIAVGLAAIDDVRHRSPRDENAVFHGQKHSVELRAVIGVTAVNVFNRSISEAYLVVPGRNPACRAAVSLRVSPVDILFHIQGWPFRPERRCLPPPRRCRWNFAHSRRKYCFRSRRPAVRR